MKRYLLGRSSILFLLAIGTGVWPADRFLQIRIEDTSQQTVQILSGSGIDFEGSITKPEAYIEVIVSQTEFSRLHDTGLPMTVVQDDLSGYYRSRLTVDRTREFGFGTMGGYYTFDEVLQQLADLSDQYPGLAGRPDTLGYSLENRPIVTMVISHNPDMDEGEPAVLYTALHHAREPQGMMTLLYFMWYLVENYGVDDEVTYLLDNRELWFIPVVNPDGYEYNRLNNPDGGGMHRKNMRPGCADQPGVDLNRNYAYNWGYDNSGSSEDPCAQTYRGTAAFSEPETILIRDFVLSKYFLLALNYHTYSNLLIYPFGHVAGAYPPEPDYGTFLEFALDMTEFNGYAIGTAPETVGYPVNGDADAWMYGEQAVFSMTPEVGSYDDGFWPPSDRIFPLAEENLYPNMYLAWNAAAYFKVAEAGWSEEVFLPGDTLSLSFAVKNNGLGPSQGSVQVGMEPVNPLVQVVGASSYQLEPLAGRAQIPGLGTTVVIDPGTPSGSVTGIRIMMTDESGYPFLGEITFRVGQPMLLWQDDAESGMTGWTTESWGSTATSHSGDLAYTDSPGGNYPPGAMNTLTLTQPFDFAQVADAWLTFWSLWSIESHWDWCQMEASADGIVWESLPGRYTRRASGYGAQLEGSGWDGEQSSWVEERVSLAPFAGEPQVYLRFLLSSDGYIEMDGFYLDDLDLYVIGDDAAALPGDVNQDGGVDVLDIVRMVQIILDQGEDPSGYEIWAADVNQDGFVDVLDIVIVVGMILDGR